MKVTSRIGWCMAMTSRYNPRYVYKLKRQFSCL